MYVESQTIVYKDEREMNQHAYEMMAQGWQYTKIQYLPHGIRIDWLMYDYRKWSQSEYMIQ